MLLQAKPVTLEQFNAFVQQPENEERLFELIHGEIIEVSPWRTRYSQISQIVAHIVLTFCEQNDLPCETSGGDGAYLIQGNVVAPDFAYKHTPMIEDYPDPEPPLWVIEVISPTDKAQDIQKKRQIYREAGILLWEIYYKSQTIEVDAPGQPPRTVGVSEDLGVGDIIPGFTLPVRKLFSR